MLELRWALHYLSKPPILGGWNNPYQNPEFLRGNINRFELSYALVEGRDETTREIHTLIKALNEDFIGFEWLANAAIPMSAMANGRKIKVDPNIIGLRMIITGKAFSYFTNGKSLFKEIRQDGYYK